MAVDNIIDKILKDAGARAESLLAAASLEAENILDKAREEAERLRQNILDEANARSKLEMERTYMSKSLEIRKDILRKKRELMDKAMAEAFEKLLALDEHHYLELLEHAIVAALAASKEAEIQFCRHDEHIIKKDFIEKLNKKHGLHVKAGAYLERRDRGVIIGYGNIMVNLTFTNVFGAFKGIIDFELAKTLFG